MRFRQRQDPSAEGDGHAVAGWTALASLLGVIAALACSEGTESGAPAATPSGAPPAGARVAAPSPEDTQAALVARGKRIYTANCIACHNPDPNRDGGLGPAVAGSSVALLEARVLRGEYPPGYVPKRKTGAMIALPHLAPDIEALAAYLAEAEKSS